MVPSLLKTLLRNPNGHFKIWKSSTSCHFHSEGQRPVLPVSMTYSSFESTLTTSQQPPIVIMHGLLGSKLNWKSLAKVLCQKSERTVFTVDARNHGESPHTDEFNYMVMGADLVHFMKEHNMASACIMGHSMGGRAAMVAALQNPELLEKLFVLDISPCGVSESKSSLPKFLELMRHVEIPSQLSLSEGRKFFDERLKQIVPEISIRQFILSNLLKTENIFSWRVNVEAISRHFDPHISTFPLAQSGMSFDKETFFIGGALSNHIRREDHGTIRELFPQASFHYIEGAGHWLHADKPQDFLNLVLPLLKN